MWNKKRLDDLEGRIIALERERVYIPGRDRRYVLSEALSIVIRYLHLQHRNEATTTGIFDKKELGDTNG